MVCWIIVIEWILEKAVVCWIIVIEWILENQSIVHDLTLYGVYDLHGTLSYVIYYTYTNVLYYRSIYWSLISCYTVLVNLVPI